MKDYIRVRATELAEFIIKTKSTVRDVAKIFSVSKSTVHTEMSYCTKDFS